MFVDKKNKKNKKIKKSFLLQNKIELYNII